MNINQAIGAIIRRRMKSLEMTAATVAEKSGYTVQTIYNVTHGRHNISIIVLCDVCQTLGIVPDHTLRDAKNSLTNQNNSDIV